STAYHVGQVVGLLILLVVAIAVLRSHLSPVVRAVVVVVAGALFVVGLKSVLANASNPAWSTNQGVNLRAGFIAGCTNGVSSRQSKCECVFQHVSSVPPYDTPSGFEQLAVALRRAGETRNVAAVPAALIDAGRPCAN